MQRFETHIFLEGLNVRIGGGMSELVVVTHKPRHEQPHSPKEILTWDSNSIGGFPLGIV